MLLVIAIVICEWLLVLITFLSFRVIVCKGTCQNIEHFYYLSPLSEKKTEFSNPKWLCFYMKQSNGRIVMSNVAIGSNSKWTNLIWGSCATPCTTPSHDMIFFFLTGAPILLWISWWSQGNPVYLKWLLYINNKLMLYYLVYPPHTLFFLGAVV